jgi:hypothetical protein
MVPGSDLRGVPHTDTSAVTSELKAHERLLGAYNNVGCLMAIESDGRCAHVGTVVLVQWGTRKLLMTAEHVVSGIVGRDGQTRVGLASSSLAARAVEFAYTPEIVWQSTLLDVALLTCPQSLIESSQAGWFDLAENASMISRVRTERFKYDTETTTLPYFVIGVPNFSRLTSEKHRMQVHGVVALPAYVDQLERHPWAGERAKGPQMHLELDVDAPNPRFAPHDPLGTMMFYRAAATRFQTGEEFGGLSGGPVVLVDGSGVFLLGIVKQGSVIFGNKRVIATALDDVVATPGFPAATA